MKSNIQADLFGQEQEADDITERSRVKCIRQLERLKVSTLTKNFTTILLGMEWTSLNCKLVWTFKGTKYGRFYCQLKPIMPDESTLWPTPRAQEPGKTSEGYGACLNDVINGKKMQHLLPTPTASDVEGGISNPKQISQKNGRFIRTSNNTGTEFGAKLRDVVHLLPTPSSFDWNTAQVPEKYAERKKKMEEKNINLHYPLKQWVMDINPGGKTAQLSPQFVLEMMGFPTDWTELPFQ